MEYIIYKDFIGKAICGEVNLPKGTDCTEKGGMIYNGESELCLKRSENAFRYFARNNDGKGIRRGELIDSIKTILALNDEHHYERWHRVWNDPACRQFNNNPNADSWVWNYAFYNAEVFTLEYIENLITNENWLGLVEEVKEPDQATEGDYINALEELGVNFDEENSVE